VMPEAEAMPLSRATSVTAIEVVFIAPVIAKQASLCSLLNSLLLT
jgi:hypothetical protein